MKKVYLLLFLGLAITLSGCKKQPIIYANHDITACGVDDPLVNLPWLAELCNNSMDEKDMSISILQDTVTMNYYFKTLIRFELRGRGEFVEGDIYDCNGNVVVSYTTVTPPTPETVAFEENKQKLGVIWSIKQ